MIVTAFLPICYIFRIYCRLCFALTNKNKTKTKNKNKNNNIPGIGMQMIWCCQVKNIMLLWRCYRPLDQIIFFSSLIRICVTSYFELLRHCFLFVNFVWPAQTDRDSIQFRMYFYKHLFPPAIMIYGFIIPSIIWIFLIRDQFQQDHLTIIILFNQITET